MKVLERPINHCMKSGSRLYSVAYAVLKLVISLSYFFGIAR